jgi:CheY-like chemotaxis protein
VSRHRVLLVEDDRDQRSGLADILRAEGYDVAEADSAEVALVVLQSQPFDLLISDYQLGGATGAWLARIATVALQPSALRTLIVTGHDHVNDADGLKVLRKPLDVDRFLAEVRQTLTFQPVAPTDSREPAQRIAFILYVNHSLSSGRTITALRELFAGYDDSQIGFTIVDLSRQGEHQAEEHRVVVTPTLIKTFPAPRVWITGSVEKVAIIEGLLHQAGVEARK